MEIWSIFVFITIIQSASTAGGYQPYSTTLETDLRKALFTGYEVLQRPSEQLSVKMAFNLITVNGLDIKDQILSTTGFFTMLWYDDRLDWSANMSTYGNIRFIFSNENYMWRPAIVIENSVRKLEVFSDENSLIRVKSGGSAYWTPGGIFETSCDADVTYYPLDTQTCSIVLTTWAYTANEVKLIFEDEPIIMDNFSPNGEWDVVETSTSIETSNRKTDSNTYDRIYFTLKLKRRPLFHILNTILPVLLMAYLIIFVFKLPPESGERVGMSLTVLLAYAVYLTLISDNIPQTSLSASILSTYLTIILMLSTLSVIFTIVVLDIYFNHSDDEEPPSWIQSFTRVVLVRMAMWKVSPSQACCNRRSKIDNFEGSDIVNDKGKDAVANEHFSMGRVNTIMVKEPLQADNSAPATDEVEEKQYSWKEVALILDRCFMYMFIFLVVVCTVVCLAILASGGS